MIKTEKQLLSLLFDQAARWKARLHNVEVQECGHILDRFVFERRKAKIASEKCNVFIVVRGIRYDCIKDVHSIEEEHISPDLTQDIPGYTDAKAALHWRTEIQERVGTLGWSDTVPRNPDNTGFDGVKFEGPVPVGLLERRPRKQLCHEPMSGFPATLCQLEKGHPNAPKGLEDVHQAASEKVIGGWVAKWVTGRVWFDSPNSPNRPKHGS